MDNRSTTNIKKGTILGLFSTMKYKSKSSLLTGLIAIPIIIILASTLYAYEALCDLKAKSTEISDQLIDDKTDLIITAIGEDYKYAKLQTDAVKRKIVDELNQSYGDDKESMRTDYLSHNIDSRFYQILSSCIANKYINKDSSANRMFIATRNEILIDNSLEYFDNSFKSWDILIAESADYKSTLLKKSLNQLNTQDDNIILWIDANQTINNIDSIEKLDESISAFIYDEIANNSIDDLKKFSIITASYIFDHKDIFDIPDVESGVFTNNDKLYIIQTFNIGDIVDSNNELMTSINEYETIALSGYQFLTGAVHKITIFAVFLVIFEILTFFGIWYLVEYYIYSKNKNKIYN